MLEAGIFTSLWQLEGSTCLLNCQETILFILEYYLHVDTTACSVYGGASFTKLPSRLALIV